MSVPLEAGYRLHTSDQLTSAALTGATGAIGPTGPTGPTGATFTAVSFAALDLSTLPTSDPGSGKPWLKAGDLHVGA